MKKIIAILSLAVSGLAMADSVTLQTTHVNNVGSAGQQQLALNVKHDFTSSLSGDVVFTQTQTDGTNALSNRLETGLTQTFPVLGLKGYTRVAVGEKYSNTTAFGYYVVEPGVSMPVGPTTVKVGVRYRSATDSGLNNDQTHTNRVSVSYPLGKSDSIAVGYDRVRGDNNQKVAAVSYTHGF